MKKKIITLLLFILAMIMCFPIVFLLSGSIMGAAEIKEYLGPVLNDGSGYVTWSVLPKYATLRSYVELLLDTPKFFCDVLEFCRYDSKYFNWTVSSISNSSLGICTI